MINKLFIIFLLIIGRTIIPQTFFTRVTDTGDLNTSGAGFSSSWGDINNDGYPDLVKLEGSKVQLFTNNGDGSFTRIDYGHLVNTQFFQNSVVFGDYNNDGYLDIYVSNLGPGTPIQPGQPLSPQINFLYKNRGLPYYEFDLETNNGLDSDSNMTWTSSWVDYNNDGFIDLFVPGDQGDKDLFFVNNGDGSFTENDSISFLNPGEFSAAGSFTDLDNDGDQDLLVVNYQGVNNELYRNELIESGDPSFTKIISGPVVTDNDYDLAPSFGDYNNDGLIDIFIGTWIGNRNLLFRNNDNFNFTKVTGDPIVEQTWTLAYTWIDFNNDGYLDCFVANSQGQKNTLYQNNGNDSFSKVNETDAGDILSSWGFTSGASAADYDNDGDIDIFVPGEQASLFRNNVGSNNNWLIVSCKGTESNKLGIGTKIKIKAEVSNGNSVWQFREIHGGPTGDRAQNNQRAHFGLGSAATIDSLILKWPSGIRDIYTNVEINQFFTATEGNGTTDIQNNNQHINDFELYQNYPNPFNPITKISYKVNLGTDINLSVYNQLGELVEKHFNGYKEAGVHSAEFDGKDLASGIYFYSLTSEDFWECKKMILLK